MAFTTFRARARLLDAFGDVLCTGGEVSGSLLESVAGDAAAQVEQEMRDRRAEAARIDISVILE